MLRLHVCLAMLRYLVTELHRHLEKSASFGAASCSAAEMVYILSETWHHQHTFTGTILTSHV